MAFNLVFNMSESSSLYETQTANGVFVIRFTDEEMLSSDFVDKREKELCELFETTECTQIVLDFSVISFLNSTGLSLLITLMRRAKENDRVLELCSLQPQIDEVLKITQFHKLFTIHRDAKELLA
jgi:anti-anti-sigma factor